jgi:biopolymer transport protein ExbB/TolQ
MRSPWLWGLVASAAFYACIFSGLLRPLAKGRVHDFLFRYCAGHPVEIVETALFFVGMAVLLLKWRDVAGQQTTSRESLLGPPQTGQTADDCEQLLRRLHELPTRLMHTLLAMRLHEALRFVQRQGSADGLDQELKSLAELDEARAHSGYNLVRVIIGAIPILGFLGTVIGITLAIANLDPKALETSMTAVIAGLGVAFDTTALALALSMGLMFTQFVVDRSEQALLAQVEQRVSEELAERFRKTGTSSDPQMAAVRRMAESVIHAVGQIVQRQTELWEESLSAAQQRWSQLVSSSQQQVEAALTQAVKAGLQSHTQQLVEAGRLLAEQNRQHALQMQEALTEGTRAVGSLQQEMSRQARTLQEVVSATADVVKAEDALRSNLAALAGAHNFAETIDSLAAVIHLLNARLARGPLALREEAPSSGPLAPRQEPGHASPGAPAVPLPMESASKHSAAEKRAA